MRIVITGAAGFIGSQTAHLLLSSGHDVIGIDSMTNYYDPLIKVARVAQLVQTSNFSFQKRDLAKDDCRDLLDQDTVVIHLAAQPGVRASWSEFESYANANVTATKHLLDAALECGVPRVIYASSSSVYGNSSDFPTTETAPLEPMSPYAVSKLAGEQLCRLYASERGLHTTSLRYFTVYGPGQRPDMLTHRLIAAAHNGAPVRIFGTGNQIRDFTFVGDVARANIAAITADSSPGQVFNIAGGSAVSIKEMIESVEAAVGLGQRIQQITAPPVSGDVPRTDGSASLAESVLGWKPTVELDQGISAQVDDFRSTRAQLPRYAISA